MTTSSAPDGADVRLASGRRSWAASPDVLTVGPDGDRGFTLSAPDTFRGPGAVLVEVTTATDESGNEDTTTTDDGATVLLSIPVLVGDDKPELECPSSVVPISAGQRYDLDIATFCKVFTVDPRDEAGPRLPRRVGRVRRRARRRLARGLRRGRDGCRHRHAGRRGRAGRARR